MSVRAFQPTSYEPPQFVAEDIDELEGRVGEIVPGPQCESCGNSCYRVERVGNGFVARCVTDPDRAPDYEQFTGCNRSVPISIWDDDEVVF